MLNSEQLFFLAHCSSTQYLKRVLQANFHEGTVHKLRHSDLANMLAMKNASLEQMINSRIK